MSQEIRTDRERQVATMKERYGKDAYERMGRERMKTMTKAERREFSRRASLKKYHPEWSEQELQDYMKANPLEDK
jgi:hypothetical protein